MKSILFLTIFASPYRVQFFDELGKYADLTVLLTDGIENITHRDAAWFENSRGGFRAVELKKTADMGDETLCLEVLSWLKKPWDEIVICGYASPTCMLAMAYLKARRIPFWMEVDGGLIRQEGKLKYVVKRRLVTLAPKFLSSGPNTTRYLCYYGAKPEQIREYPFTSLYERDILPQPLTREEKLALRQKLGIREERMILSVGRFIPGKGFDVLLDSAVKLPEDTGVYIVGGDDFAEYEAQRQRLGLDRVCFLPFRKKEQLLEYYRAADLFVLPTRSDVWGLVINEAMASGLPVVTTTMCVAGLDLIEDGVNGYLVPIDDAEALADRMNRILSGDPAALSRAALERIRPYTFEQMAKVHAEIFGCEG